MTSSFITENLIPILDDNSLFDTPSSDSLNLYILHRGYGVDLGHHWTITNHLSDTAPSAWDNCPVLEVTQVNTWFVLHVMFSQVPTGISFHSSVVLTLFRAISCSCYEVYFVVSILLLVLLLLLCFLAWCGLRQWFSESSQGINNFYFHFYLSFIFYQPDLLLM